MNEKNMYSNDHLSDLITHEVKKLTERSVASSPAYQAPTTELINKYKTMPIPKKGKGIEKVVDLLNQEILNYNLATTHPRYFSFVPGPASPLSWLTDILTSAHNVHASNFSNAALPITIEHRLIHYLSEKIGFNPSLSSGVFVSGGSSATLTAVTAARDAMTSLTQLPKSTVYMTRQAHFSVAKAFHIAGFAASQIRYIPTDADFTMDVTALKEQIQQDIVAGYKPTIIVITTGTTNTGAIDDLESITQIAHEHHMWVHADGAYGLSHIFTQEGAKKLRGIEHVDSVTWDAHKLLFQTYSCAMVIVKDKKHLLQTYGVSAEYLDDVASKDNIDPDQLGIELTRPPRGLKLWVTLQTLGEEEITRRIAHGQEMARYAAQQVERMPQWQVVTPPQLSILNIRYEDKRKTTEQNNQILQYAAQRMASSGYAVTYTTRLNEHRVIRLCTINPNTTTADIDGTLERLNTFVQEAYATL